MIHSLYWQSFKNPANNSTSEYWDKTACPHKNKSFLRCFLKFPISLNRRLGCHIKLHKEDEGKNDSERQGYSISILNSYIWKTIIGRKNGLILYAHKGENKLISYLEVDWA